MTTTRNIKRHERKSAASTVATKKPRKSHAPTMQPDQYLSLIKSAPLEQLQEFADDMDFSYRDSDGNDAVLAACMHGRKDVLEWLINEQHLSLDTVNHLNVEPIVMLANHQHWEILNTLVDMSAQGKPGWQINQRFTKNHPYDTHRPNLQQPPYIITTQYPEITLGYHEQLSVFHTGTGTVDTYRLGSFLSAGGFGKVFKYSTPDKKSLVAKTPKKDWRKERGFKKKRIWEEIELEYDMLIKAYPDEGPYALQRLSKQKNGKTYSTYRMTMPLIAGDKLGKLIKPLLNTNKLHLALLRSAQELQRIHELGIIHGDIRIGNVLFDETDGDIKVHYIDFGLARTPGVADTKRDDDDEIFAPEKIKDGESHFYTTHTSQDVYSLARLFDYWLQMVFSEKQFNFFLSVRQSSPLNDDYPPVGDCLQLYKLKQFFTEYPSIKSFMQTALSEDPQQRPTLPDFIQALTRDIQRKQQQKNTISLKHRGMFSQQPACETANNRDAKEPKRKRSLGQHH